MIKKLFAVCVVSIVLSGIGSAQEAVTSRVADSSYSKSQVKRLVRTAHSPEQFRALAGYYDELQKHYMKLAAEAKVEWEERSAGVASNRAKYPNPADTSRNFYEYNMSKASEAGALVAKFSRLAEQGAPLNAQ